MLCSGCIDNAWHIFLACPFAQDCLREANLFSAVEKCSEDAESFLELLFAVLDKFSVQDSCNFVVLLAGIWRSRNEKVWQDVFVPPVTNVFWG